MKNLIIIAAFILGAILLIRFFSNRNKPYTDIMTGELADTLQQMPNALLLDIRTPKEIDLGMIPGAEHMDFYEKNFRDTISSIQKDRPIILYCRSGNRSVKAAYILDSLGYTKLYNLKLGYKDWIAKQPAQKIDGNN
jgi:rhodanese-related sulfurtransferase